MDTPLRNDMDIRVQADGCYLYVRHPDGAPKVSRMDVLGLIESYGVSDVDFVALNEALKEDKPELALKISDNTNIIQVDESAMVEVAADRMSAGIIFSEPVNKGAMMTLDDVMALIEKAGVVGADRDKVAATLANKRYERKYVIHEGTPPTPGMDGALRYHFDNSNLRPKPKILDDGTVDFRQLGLLRLCSRGDILVTVIREKPGVDGTDVYGNTVPAPKPKPAQPIPRGKNTNVTPDSMHLVAEVSGQLIIADRKINISPALDINGNVDNSTGDIDFNGTVSVRGNVVSGFTVKATGNIDVMGVCEAARLITDGHITLGNGCQGGDKAELTAGGDITAKFIESCTVTAGGNIMADSIRNSTVKCDGDVILTGKNGLLVGGSVIAGNKLSAITIGSPMGTQTEIEAGSNPQHLVHYHGLTTEYNKLKLDYSRCDQTISTLNDMKKRGQLNDEKKALLLKMINLRAALREKLEKQGVELDALSGTLSTNSGSVAAQKVIRPGVRVTIGNAQLLVREELSRCRLTNNGVKIAVGPY